MAGRYTAARAADPACGEHARRLVRPPLRAASYFGFAAGVVGLLLGGMVLWRFATAAPRWPGSPPWPRWSRCSRPPRLMSIGVLGGYVGRIHGNGMGRPTYVVCERAGSPDGAAPRRHGEP